MHAYLLSLYSSKSIFFMCSSIKKNPVFRNVDWYKLLSLISDTNKFFHQDPPLTPFLTLLMLNCDVRCPNLTRMTAYHRRCNRQRNNWYVRWEVYRWVIDWIYPVNEALLTADKACLSTRSRLSVSPIVYCLSKMLYLWYFACSRFDFKIRQNFSLDLKIDVHASNTWIEFI